MNAEKMMVILVLAAATAKLAVAGDRPAEGPPRPTELQAYTSRALRQHFPNVPLLTQDGKKVRFYDDVIKGKIVLIQFMFVNCERFCPMVTPNLVKVQKELHKQSAKDVSLVSITVDPEHDTPEVLKAYAKQFQVQPGWQFLTGSKSDIDRIRRELGVYDPDDRKLEHMNLLTIGKEPTGQWLSIRGLARPDVIAYTVLRLTTRTGAAGRKPTTTSGPRSTAGN